MLTDLLTYPLVPVFAQQMRDATLDAIVASLIVVANALPLLVFAAL
jgi:hypothetical protein